ncbi:MAG: hypothetical protein M1829_004471 [Trizodia sp. TS-e1964]|nr:MAG: hypothetical protein M1829_004471 [Trizodia sp. TS-e1964]
MTPSNQPFYSSPVAVLQASPPSMLFPTLYSRDPVISFPSSLLGQAPQATRVLARPRFKAPLAVKTSRKRSRDDMISEDQGFPSDAFVFGRVGLSPKSLEPVQGEASKSYQPKGLLTNAHSQTFPLAKALIELPHSESPAPPFRTQSRDTESEFQLNRKSQRLDSTSSKSNHLAESEVYLALGSPLKSNQEDPKVDDITILLGVGWTRLSEDLDIQAAARGWAKYIENHYSLSRAVFMLRSKGLGSYLVCTTEGFFLFREDLREGRLVSTDLNMALENLSTSPVRYEGAEVLSPIESPASTPTIHITNLDLAANTVNTSTVSGPLAQAPSGTMMAKLSSKCESESAGQEFAMDLD